MSKILDEELAQKRLQNLGAIAGGDTTDPSLWRISQEQLDAQLTPNERIHADWIHGAKSKETGTAAMQQLLTPAIVAAKDNGVDPKLMATILHTEIYHDAHLEWQQKLAAQVYFGVLTAARMEPYKAMSHGPFEIRPGLLLPLLKRTAGENWTPEEIARDPAKGAELAARYIGLLGKVLDESNKDANGGKGLTEQQRVKAIATLYGNLGSTTPNTNYAGTAMDHYAEYSKEGTPEYKDLTLAKGMANVDCGGKPGQQSGWRGQGMIELRLMQAPSEKPGEAAPHDKGGSPTVTAPPPKIRALPNPGS